MANAFVRRNGPLIGILFLTALVFGQALWFDYVNWDDNAFLQENALLRLPFAEAMRTAFGQFFMGDYVPVTLMSFWLETAATSGPQAPVSHAINLVFHLSNIVLLWIWLRPLLGDPRWRAAVCAVFALHPVQTESVVWVSERKGLLCAFFTFLALLALQRWDRRWIYKLAYPLFFLLALLCKASVVFVPVLMLYSERRLLGLYWKQSFRRQAAALALAACIAVIRVKAYGNYVPQVSEASLNLSRWTAFPVQLVNAFGFYLQKVFWPQDLGIIYPKFAWNWGLLAGTAAFLVWAAFCVYQWRKSSDRRLLFFILLSVLFLLPVMQIVPRLNYVNDRYLYLPVIGVAAVLFSIWRPRMLIACTTVFMAVCSFQQARQWRSNLDLWRRTVELAPENSIAHLSFGRALETSGDIDSAMKEYTAAALAPGSEVVAQALNNISILHSKPDLPRYYNLGESERFLKLAIGSSISRVDQLYMRYNLARLQLQMGKKEDARRTCEDVLLDVNTIGDSALIHLNGLIGQLMKEL